MKKKITSSALAALMIAGSTSFSALAAMSNGTVVIGTKAFDLAYANDPANADEIGNAIVGMAAGESVYVKGFDGNWVENTTGKTIEASVIPAVTYKDAAGKVSEITKGDAGTVVVDGSLKVKAVKAISNTKVEVSLEEAVTAVDAANFKVTKKGATDVLEVKSASISGKIVVLETAAQTAGSAYTLTVNDKAINFTGLSVDKEAAKATKIECVDTNSVVVTFDKRVDEATATNIANYKLNNNAVVIKAKLDSTRKEVTLTTEGVANNKLYKLTAENLLSVDGVKIAKITKDFVGKVDSSAIQLSSITVVNNTRLTVKFSDAHGVDKESAEKIENYTIKSGSDVLNITSATAKDVDDDGYYEIVEFVTDVQNPNKTYTLSVSNVADGSVSKNVPTKALTKDFRGKVADKTPPTVKSVKALTNTMIQVEFTDSNALDVASATDSSNYVFNNDLTIEKVEIKDTTDAYSDLGKTVIITTSTQTAGKNYTLEIKGVQDEFGNALKALSGSTYRKYTFGGVKEDTVAPFVASIANVDDTTVKVTFDNLVNKATAEDPTNYTINKDLGAVLKATLGKDGKTVTLKTPVQTANVTYTITMNGIKDLSGNELLNVKTPFVSTPTTLDTTRPEVSYVEALYENEVKVYLSEEVQNGTISMTVVQMKDGKTVGSPVTLNKVGLLNDGTTLVMKPATVLVQGEYKVTSITGVKDLSNNLLVMPTSDIIFYGTKEKNEGPTVLSYEQINTKTLRVTFSEPVLSIGTPSGVKTVTVDPDDDGHFEIVEYKFTSNFEKEVKWDFSTLITDLVGTKALDEDDTTTDLSKKTTITASYEDKDKAYIVDVLPTTKNKIKVTFNEGIDSLGAGSYRVSYKDKNNVTRYIALSGASVDAVDDKIVNIATRDDMNSQTVYTLEPISGAKDIAGNISDIKDVKVDFVGSDVTTDNFVTGVIITDGTNISVKATQNITSVVVKELNADGDEIGKNLLKSTTDITTKTVKVELQVPVLSGKKYKVTTDIGSYTFSGNVTDAGIRIIQNDATGVAATISYSGMDLTKQDVTVYDTSLNVVSVSSTGTIASVGADTELYVVVTRKGEANVVYSAKVKVEAPENATVKEAYTAADVTAALADNSVTTIRLYEDVTTNIVAARIVNIDLNGKKVTGNVTINGAGAGVITIGAGKIDGNLTINTPNATVINQAEVTGTTTITNVSANTFSNKGVLGTLVITDNDGTSFNNEGTVKAITISATTDESNPVVLKGSIADDVIITVTASSSDVLVEAGATVGTINVTGANSVIRNNGTIKELQGTVAVQLIGVDAEKTTGTVTKVEKSAVQIATEAVEAAQANLDKLVNPTDAAFATAKTNVELKPTAEALATAEANIALKPTAEALAAAKAKVEARPTAEALAAAELTLTTAPEDADALAVVAAEAAAVAGEKVVAAEAAAVAGEKVVAAEAAAVAGQKVVEARNNYVAAVKVLDDAKAKLAQLQA